MELDRTRPFGTLYPPVDGARFIQDGTYFDAKGLSLESTKNGNETGLISVFFEQAAAVDETTNDATGADAAADIKDLDLDSLTKRELEQLAREAYGVELDRRQRLDDLRAQVRALIEA